MSTMSAVYDALMARVATIVTGSPTLPVAYPEVGETFSPPADGRYLEVAFYPNRPLMEGLAAGVKIDQGLLQITVVWPKNDGLVRPLEVAEIVKAHFAKGLPMTATGAVVRVSKETWIAAPLSGTADVRVPVTVSWTA